jgi:hypothetical protein
VTLPARALLWLLIGAAVLVLPVGAWQAWRHADARAEQAEAELAHNRRVLTQLREAQRLGDELSARLLAAEAERAQLTQERDDAIARATTGRACLGSRALRVLDGAPGLRVAVVPAAAASAAAAHAAAAADPGAAGADADASSIAGPGLRASGVGLEPVSDDTAIARWILHAGAQYETCRARLHALIDYSTGAAAHAP